MSNQNPNRVLPAMTAEAYLKHKEVIEAWMQGADVEMFNRVYSKWCNSSIPKFEYEGQYRIKPTNINKYIIVGLMVMRATIPAVCGVPRLKHAVLMG